jgi:protease IV
MAEKKHPILIVLAILLGVGLFLGTVLVIVLKVISPASTLSFSDRIGVIPIEGAILDSQTITEQLLEFKKDKGISAVILRINSPGGGVGPTQEIYREVQRTGETKQIIASLGAVAASGGYYIATATQKIVANPGTITGSIGVLMEFVRFEELLDKIGVTLEVIQSGEFKDIGSPHRELTAREKEIIRTLIDDIQKQFVNAVASGRNLSLEKTREIADGRIFSGARAKELGLVDDLGNFQDAVEIAKKIAGIEGDVTLVYPKKSKLELWDLILGRAAGSVVRLIQNMKTTFEYRWSGLQLPNVSERY